jgi:hypothetical protein
MAVRCAGSPSPVRGGGAGEVGGGGDVNGGLMIMSLRAHVAKQPPHNEETLAPDASAGVASSRQTLLATTSISLCDVLEALLQPADAKREQGRLVRAVMAGVGG